MVNSDSEKTPKHERARIKCPCKLLTVHAQTIARSTVRLKWRGKVDSQAVALQKSVPELHQTLRRYNLLRASITASEEILVRHDVARSYSLHLMTFILYLCISK